MKMLSLKQKPQLNIKNIAVASKIKQVLFEKDLKISMREEII